MLGVKRILPRDDSGLPVRIEATTIREAANLNELYYSGYLVPEETKAEFINDDELRVTVTLKRNGDQ